MKSKVIKTLAIALPILMMLSCTADDDNGNIIEGTNSIIDYLDRNPEYSQFRSAIAQAGISGLLQGNSGSFTVFAPNNDSFNAYLRANQIDTIAELSSEKVSQLVNYHILLTLNSRNTFSTSYLKTRGEVQVNDSTQSRLSMLVEVQDTLIKLNENVQISRADIQVDNGILHQVDGVLSPPTLETFMQADENLTPFYNALLANNSSTDFESFLNGNSEARKTLFVPNENAVNDFLGQNYFSEEILRNHFLDSLQLTTELSTGYRPSLARKMLNGNETNIEMFINTQIGIVINDTATVTVSDLVATNGVLHATNQVLFLPRVSNFIKADPQLNTLQEAIELQAFVNDDYFGLLNETNSMNSPFTLLGPNIDAFDQLLTELFPTQEPSLDDIPENQLRNILETHIIPQNQFTVPFANRTGRSINGENLSFDGTTVTDENGNLANIQARNAQAVNGVVHRIDTVLRAN